MKDMTYFNRIQTAVEGKFVNPRVINQASTVVDGTNYIHKIEDVSDNVTQWCVYHDDGKFLGARIAVKNPLAGELEPNMTTWINNPGVEKIVSIRRGDSSIAFEIETWVSANETGLKRNELIYFGDYDGSVEVNKLKATGEDWQMIGHTTVDEVVDAIDSSDFEKIFSCGFLETGKKM